MQAKPTLGELWSLSCEAGSVERERSELRNLPCETRSAERESKGTKAIIDKDSFMNCLHMITRVPHFSNPSCIHHIGRFSPMNISHMIPKVPLIWAFFIEQ